MAGYSVSTEPSSRTSVGTFDFGLTEVNSGLNCPPSRRLTSFASYCLPISSNSTWMPIDQAACEYISFMTLSLVSCEPRATRRCVDVRDQGSRAMLCLGSHCEEPRGVAVRGQRDGRTLHSRPARARKRSRSRRRRGWRTIPPCRPRRLSDCRRSVDGRGTCRDG